MRTTVQTSLLTAAQLDGLACVDCGSPDTPQQPTGERAPGGAQLFRCVGRTACPAPVLDPLEAALLAAFNAGEPCDDEGEPLETVAAESTQELLAERAVDQIAEALPDVSVQMSRADFVSVVSDGLRAAVRLGPVCPDGRVWCTGDPALHGDPSDPTHWGPEVSLSGSYGSGLMIAHLVQNDDGDEVRLAFSGEGDWRELDLVQTDELISDMSAYLYRLRAMRNQIETSNAVAGAVAHLRAARAGASPDLLKVLEVLEHQVRESGDPDLVFDRVKRIVAEVQAEGEGR
ncbi:DUF6907 domain-containing protein [Streptomyces microflavus]|uniref:DUF6907 domain-containing protein n=1 Tax=Streptomyces microflavus TaxID=1919 RepID=UPI0033A63F04